MIVSGFLFPATGFGADAGGGNRGPEGKWLLIPEPAFMKPAVAWEIPEAKRTVLVPTLWDGDQIHELSVAEFALTGFDRAKIGKLAGENAASVLAGLQPEYTRNAKKVIEYATLSSAQPLAAATVWAPGFVKMFEETLGSKLSVVIPNRYTVFVFPALAGNCDDYAPMLLEACRATPWPASREIFEVSKEGVRAIGQLNEP
jgi:hypothetical protein